MSVTLLQKSKREYNNLNEKKVSDNKIFWKVVKPLFSNNVISSDTTAIVEGDKTIRSDKEAAKVSNKFFSNVVTNINIPQFNQIDRASENISDPFIKDIVKYRAHLSINVVKEHCTSKSNFNFSFAEKVDILKEIKMLQSKKQHKTPTFLLN